MERAVTKMTCDAIESLPSIEQIQAIPRDMTLCVSFSPALHQIRERIGAEWKEKLHGFSVGVHRLKPEINIGKLISDEEIAEHAAFFETCARDYRNLATELIYLLATHLNETIDPDNAMETFAKYKAGRQRGRMEKWDYTVHGAHCGFIHRRTGQTIEVYLITPLEFGVLDPFFFIEFIKTTAAYRPLPVDLFDSYADGCLPPFARRPVR